MVKSICTIDSIWTAKQQKKLQEEHELKVTPNIAWKDDEEAETWTPSRNCQFNSFEGGGEPGPTQAVKRCNQSHWRLLGAFRCKQFLFLFQLVMKTT